ncbi:MAG: tetratricopeptide (TPR) repeat protein [Rubritalea sp.]|jgi:tetratricopeptide (TPR) repeat protein
MRSFFSIVCLTLTWLASAIAHAKVHSMTSSKNLITGENGYVTFVIESPTSAPKPTQIVVENAFFQLYDTDVIAQQGKRYYLMIYRFNSPNAGTFTIPATAFSATSPEDTSEPVTLIVRDKSTLKKHTVDSLSVKDPDGPTRKTYPYYTQLIAEKTSLFPSEATRLEYKIYLPKPIKVVQWGLPTGERKNVTAWRFETPNPLVRNGDVVIDGINYQAGRFHTTVSGIKPGKAVLGPFKARVIHQISMINRMGSFTETQEIFPLSEMLELEILALPPNPPADFKGDVGNFQMSVNIESKAKLKTTESIKAEVTLIGTGKFSEITPPSLTNDEHWKLISESKRDLGEQRKNIDGYAEFSYLIQPENSGPAGATTTPGFSFSYLDPELKAYRTLSHPGVPVSIILSSNTSTANLTKSADQILAITEGTKFSQKPWYRSLPLSFIHIIPGALCVLMLLRYAQQRRQAFLLNQSHKIIQRKSLTELEQKDGESFLKSASNFIQRWVDTEKHPELQDIPQLRDDHCYKPQEPIKLSEKRKIAIINALKKLTILLFFISPQLSDASAESAWNKGEYGKALTQYQALLKLPTESADLLYNIGNCHQKLNQPAHASVFYHRALLLDPYHNRAKHNLSLLQKQNNSIIFKSSITSGSLQDWLSILSLTTYYIIFSLSLWLILLTYLWVKILKPKKNTSLIITLVMLTFFSATLSGFGYFKHPDKEKITGLPFAVITKSSILTEQPITDSKRLTIATTASECLILGSRGTYSYIELANESKTRGWLRTEDLLRVVH